eukprot:1151666-Pelagomonas_calceolata.AAC.2
MKAEEVLPTSVKEKETRWLKRANSAQKPGCEKFPSFDDVPIGNKFVSIVHRPASRAGKAWAMNSSTLFIKRSEHLSDQTALKTLSIICIVSSNTRSQKTRVPMLADIAM